MTNNTNKSQSQQVTSQNNKSSNSSSNYNLYSVSNYTLNSSDQIGQGSSGGTTSSQFRTTIAKESVENQFGCMPLDLASNTSRNSVSDQRKWQSSSSHQTTINPNYKTIDLASTPVSSLWKNEVYKDKTEVQRPKKEEPKSSALELVERIKKSVINRPHPMNPNDSKTPYNNFSPPSSSSNVKPYVQNSSTYQGGGLANKHKINAHPYSTQQQPTDYSQSKMVKIESRHDYKSNNYASGPKISAELKKGKSINFQDLFQQTIQKMAASQQGHSKNSLKHKMNPTEYPKNVDKTPNFSKKKVSKVIESNNRCDSKNTANTLAAIDPAVNLVTSNKKEVQNGHQQISINDTSQPSTSIDNKTQTTIDSLIQLLTSSTDDLMQPTSSTDNMIQPSFTDNMIQPSFTDNMIQPMVTNNTIKSELPEKSVEVSDYVPKECSTPVLAEAVSDMTSIAVPPMPDSINKPVS